MTKPEVELMLIRINIYKNGSNDPELLLGIVFIEKLLEKKITKEGRIL